MPSALIVHASRHGGTAGIAERIASVLEQAGIEAVAVPASAKPDPAGYDACIVGSGVYMGSWLDEGTRFLERNTESLATRPVWLFSSGPLPGSSKELPPGTDPIEHALGPREGPGSGGRRRVEALAERIRPVDHRVFAGAFDPTERPKAFSERVVRMMPAARNVLPPGDFREWDLIQAWAEGIAIAINARAGRAVTA